MKLKSVTVSGFKNIQLTTLRIDRITAIVSPNNYGKSNLLEAIDFGMDFLSSSAKDRLQMMSWVRGIPINKSMASDEYTFEIEFDEPSLDEHRYVRYGFKFCWYKDDGTGQHITDEWLETRPSESVRYTAFLKRKEGKYRKAKTTASYRKINVSDNQLIIDLLSSISDVDINPVITAIHKIDYHVCASLELGDRFQASPIEYVGRSQDGGIAFDDEDVPRALYRLKQTDLDKYNLFLEAVYTLFPEFTDVHVQSFELKKEDDETGQGSITLTNPNGAESKIPFRMRDDIYRLVVNCKHLNQPINMASMSTGTKRIIWLLANVFIASSNKICCIGVEELETSIHPRLMRSLLDILDEALDDTTLIVSSHSPYLIQYIKPSKIYIGVPNEHGTAYFRKINTAHLKNLMEVSRDTGMAIGEYLFELMTGDRDSSIMLSFYLEN